MRKRQALSEFFKKIPEGLWIHKGKLFSLSLVLALSHMKKPIPLPLTHKEETLVHNTTRSGGRNEKYLRNDFIENTQTLPVFPYAVPSDSAITQAMPQLPDSLKQKPHVQGQLPVPVDVYGQWLCQGFSDKRDVNDLPSFVDGTIRGNQAEAICAAAAMQFLVRVYGGLPHLTSDAQNFFKMRGKSSWVLPEKMETIGYTYTPSNHRENHIDPRACKPGDIIYAKFDHSHYIQQALTESQGKYPGTHSIVYVGEQSFSIPHPCPGNNESLSILKARRQKQNEGSTATRNDNEIQNIINKGQISINIIDDSAVHITSPMIIQWLPDNPQQVTTPHLSSWREFFLKKRKGHSINPDKTIFLQTGVSHLTQPEELFENPDILTDTRRKDIKMIETVGLFRLEKDKTLSHCQQEICETYNLSQQDWGDLLKYRKITTFRDAARENFPLPIPLLTEKNKEIIDKTRREKYPTESNPVDRSNMQKYTETYNAHNLKERSQNPSSIASSGRMQVAIIPGMTKSGLCQSLRQQMITLSTDKTYQEYISFDRENFPEEKLRKARCASAQLSSEEGLPIDVIKHHPEKIQAGTTYARHIILFLQELHSDINAYHSMHTASIPTIDQIDPTIDTIIKEVTPHDDVRAIMQKIHYAENLPSSSLQIGHRRKSKKLIRENFLPFPNTTGGRRQINHENFTHPESIVKTVNHLKTLALYQNFSPTQQEELEHCETLAQNIMESHNDQKQYNYAKRQLADWLRDHILVWSTPNDSDLHRYLFEAGLVAHNIQTNKKSFVQIVQKLDNTRHNELSYQQKRVVDELVCLAHNRGPTVVRQIMTIGRLTRLIDQSRLGYRTQINKDLILVDPQSGSKYTRNKEYYQSYLEQIKSYVEQCINADINHDHPHFTQPLNKIIDALQLGTKESLLDIKVQEEIKKLTYSTGFIKLKHINLSILPTLEELYGKSESFFLQDPEVSHEGKEGKMIERQRQIVLSRITASYLDQVPKDKSLLTILLRSDALVGLLWLLVVGHVGTTLYTRYKNQKNEKS